MADTIPARLFTQAEKRPGSPAYFEKVDGEYRATSWSEYAAHVRRTGKALLAIGFPLEGKVTILGFNRPEWVILELATMAVGGAPAGIYATSSPEEVQYITAHAEAPVILVENKAQLDKVLAVRRDLPALKWIVTMRGAPEIYDAQVITWDEFLAMGNDVPDADFDARLASLSPGGLATLIYTSGTTGPPKGVMLTHANLTWTADNSYGVMPLTSDDSSVSYLPLSHIAEQMFSVHIPISIGYPIYFAESIEALLDNLKEVKPTVFFAVPRVWEKFHAGVAAELGHAKGVKAKLAAWAQVVGRQAVAIENRGGKPSGALGAKMVVAGLVHKKVKAGIGMDRVRGAITGAAPISPELLEFFAGFHIAIIEVYGQSEGSGPTTFNRPGKTKFGSVGIAYPGAEVRLADDGEVLLKGGNVFAGYFKNPAATAETLQDGWLLSGDIGTFDADGFLFITGRKKDIIITAGGKNLTPANFENSMKQNRWISQAVMYGDRRPYPVTLLTLEPDETAALATELGIENDAKLHANPHVTDLIQQVLDDVNSKFAPVEQVKKFRILDHDLTIESGDLTPSMKVKRNVVHEKYENIYDSMYGS